MSNGHLSLMRSEPPEGHRSPCYWVVLGVKPPFSIDFESLGSAYIRCSEVLYEIFIQTQTEKACLAPGSLWEAGFLGSWRTTPRLNWMKDEAQGVGIQSVRKWNDKKPGLLHSRPEVRSLQGEFRSPGDFVKMWFWTTLLRECGFVRLRKLLILREKRIFIIYALSTLKRVFWGGLKY